MCDYGRFLAEGLNDRDVDRPQIRTAEGLQPVPWREAEDRVAELLRSDPKPRVVASANHSNETLYLVKRLLVDQLGIEVVVPVDPGEPRKIKNGRRQWVHNEDAHPNAAGARRLGLKTVDETGLGRFFALAEGPIVVLDAEAHPWLASEAAASAAVGKTLAIAARRHTALIDAAELILPQTSWAESSGTYTSSTGAVQLARRAMPPAGQAKAPWRMLLGVAEVLELETPEGTTVEKLYASLSGDVPEFTAVNFRGPGAHPALPVIGEVEHVG
jgi:NADH dehydrogenase/NADH:ubiquinone oxidoreductase subunit G